MKIRRYGQRIDSLICGLVFMASTLSANISEAATYYVATDGNNANPGTESRPFLTLTKGVSVLQAGDTLSIRAGTYASVNANSIPSGTSWSNATTLAAYPGEQVVLTPPSDSHVLHFFSGTSYVILDGLILDGTNATDGAGLKISERSHHIRFINGEIRHVKGQGVLTGGLGGNEFINCKVHDNGRDYPYDHGFYIADEGNNLIENCDIYNHAFGFAIHVFGAVDSSDKNTVRNNRIFDNAWGILFQDTTNSLFYNNVIWRNGNGIKASSNHKIYRNTFFNNGRKNYPSVWLLGNGNIVENNIVASSSSSYHSGGIYVESEVVNATVHNNLILNNYPHNFEDVSENASQRKNLIGE